MTHDRLREHERLSADIEGMTLQSVITLLDSIELNIKNQIKDNARETDASQLALLQSLGKPPSVRDSARADARFALIAASTKSRVLQEVMNSIQSTKQKMVDDYHMVKQLVRTNPYKTRAVA